MIDQYQTMDNLIQSFVDTFERVRISILFSFLKIIRRISLAKSFNVIVELFIFFFCDEHQSLYTHAFFYLTDLVQTNNRTFLFYRQYRSKSYYGKCKLSNRDVKFLGKNFFEITSNRFHSNVRE